jgi:hypothetical protein
MPLRWEDVEPYVRGAFQLGGAPERGDLLAVAFDGNAPDDVIDALDTLGQRPIPTLDELRARLVSAGQLDS